MKRLLAIILSVLCILLSACSPVNPSEGTSPLNTPQHSLDLENTYGKSAYAYLEGFIKAHPKRTAGSDEEAAAAAYLYGMLESFGYQPDMESFDYNTSWAGPLSSQNVVARLKPEAARRILIGAHYDSMPEGEGADDNASGVAVLLTLAEQAKTLTLPYGIDFVLFGSEEAGLKGSKAYYEAHQPRLELMINLDSLIAGDVLYVYGESETAKPLKRTLELAIEKGLPLTTQNEKASELPYGTTLDASDHAVFKANGIPILYFEATNWSLGKHDGYTQTSHPEVKDGEFWHSSQDQLRFIESKFPNRPKINLSIVCDLIITLLQTDSWH